MTKRLNQLGDTIVEVMIAVVVLGTVISGVYTVASRSLRIARQAEERSEALKLAESQIEQLKDLAPNNSEVFTSTDVYCVDNSTIYKFGFSNLPAVNDDNFDQYPDQCVHNTLYHVAVKANTISGGADGRQFSITVRWDRIGGGRDEVQMLYRMYPE